MSKVIKANEVIIEEVPGPAGAAPGASRAVHNGGNGRNGGWPAEEARLVVEEARRQAASLIERAERLVSERLALLARKEAEIAEAFEKARAAGHKAGFDEGYGAGFREGFEQGKKEGAERVEALLASAKALLEEAKRAQWRLEERAREDVLMLAVAIAEKLVCRALEQDREAALAILKEMLAKAEGSRTARVRLPKEAFTLLEELGELQSGAANTAECEFEFIADDSLSAGDVVIETDWGLIDGRIRSRWRRIMEGLDLVEGEACGTP